MDYSAQPVLFQLRKVLRYCRLYGPRRTWVKVQAQRHLRRRFEPLPAPRRPAAHQSVGLVGCGNYAFSNIAHYLTQSHGAVLGGCMDANVHRAASLARTYGVPFFTENADELIDLPGIRIVYIASNHASHAEYAIRCLERGKDVYIEKPHVVSEDQLQLLLAAMHGSDGRVFLGFNRPGSRLGRILRDELDRETGPAMFNWFVAGHAIDPAHWYFHPDEGGRVLGNLCHWTDFLFTLAPEPRFPIRITPVRHEQSDCDLAVGYTFGDGTIGVITFSAKGHTFEGVREQFHAHRGRVLATLDDFQRLLVERGARKRRYRRLFRDHGHGANILAAYANSIERLPYDRSARTFHVANTAWLFLKTRQALEEQREIVLECCAMDVAGLRKTALKPSEGVFVRL
ncbi:MAG TPA: Gfo/Idh/MocA family oxidoreductase [Planctomycetaceae bacterium]|nr:Gfo/Idh/MocA family oxidoreductase [Planctomycetaceae bacterium]